MKAFAELYARLDASTSSHAKLEAMQDYFRDAQPADSAWAVYFLCGGKPRQLVPTKLLRELITTTSQLPQWLFDECYQAVGDLAETLSLLLPLSSTTNADGLASWVEGKLLPLRDIRKDLGAMHLMPLLDQLDRGSQLVFLKLITGSFRVGVSKLLVTRALAALAGLDAKLIAQRLVGYTDGSSPPTADRYQRLISQPTDGAPDDRDAGQPYPFFLAHSLQLPVTEFQERIGPPSDWQIEWKWDGIRAQIVKRHGTLWIWSRGEELVTERFPELSALASTLPDGTILDGEIVVWKADQVQPFALLQQRIARKRLPASLLKDAPVIFVAYDLLEWRGVDWRTRPQRERRQQLEHLVREVPEPHLRLSELLEGATWSELDQQRARSRGLGVEGMMLKGKEARYGVGRTKEAGVWWKWKIDPYTVDAVLIYAQRGHGRRASLYTDFTFAVWSAGLEVADRRLIPFAKAYSGLTDDEMRQVDAIVRKTTIEKFGPMRSVTPTLVFEIGFEGIGASARHKSGIAVRFPRILRWRQDKPLAEADTLETLRALLPPTQTPGAGL
ncbi:MAG: ATP-dependent DNA ligase [Verrucomicrobiales bacterium]|nr:ATP-dependent DNA ligase [Verrucomicrobiales bacterium]